MYELTMVIIYKEVWDIFADSMYNYELSSELMHLSGLYKKWESFFGTVNFRISLVKKQVFHVFVRLP